MSTPKIEIPRTARCTFNICIETDGRILLDTTIDAVGTDESIQKARKTISRLLTEYTPTVQATPPVSDPRTKGPLILHCGQCGNTFNTFLSKAQSSYVCRCGHRIDLTAGLVPYRFTCPQCKKIRYGRTNVSGPSVTGSCDCGKLTVLSWDQKAGAFIGTESGSKGGTGQ